MIIRTTRFEDVPALQEVLDGAELFPGEMLPDMIQGFLSDADSSVLWLTCEAGGRAVGFCYAAPEEMTDGTWNMLAIAVHPEHQGRGFGTAIVKQLETMLGEHGHRVLIVDTSGVDRFAQTREFYRRNGYVEEARIRDFWAPGDDKVVFWKSLM